MVATIKFNLPDDDMAYKQCNSARDMAMALWDISNLWTKHARPKSVGGCLNRIREILDEYDLNMDKLIE